MQPLHCSDGFTNAKNVVPVHIKLRSSRLLSQYICNIPMSKDTHQKNDFALYIFLQESISGFHSNMLKF